LALQAADPVADIVLQINSPGAQVHSVLALTDVINALSCPVRTVAFGFVAGTSNLLLASGAKGKRGMMPNARLMLQQPFGYAAGSAPEVHVTATEVSRNLQVVNTMLAARCGRTLQEVEEATDRDMYLGGEAAVAFGLVDEVVVSGKFPGNGTPEPLREAGVKVAEMAKLANKRAVTGYD